MHILSAKFLLKENKSMKRSVLRLNSWARKVVGWGGPIDDGFGFGWEVIHKQESLKSTKIIIL